MLTIGAIEYISIVLTLTTIFVCPDIGAQIIKYHEQQNNLSTDFYSRYSTDGSYENQSFQKGKFSC